MKTYMIYYIRLTTILKYSQYTQCSTMAFPPLGNSDNVLASVSIELPSNSQGDALFHHIAYDYSCADWESL